MPTKYNVTSIVSSDKADFVRFSEVFTASAAQVDFVLTKTPLSIGTITFRINGIAYQKVTDFTISSLTVTWTDTEFVLEDGDIVEIEYDFSS